MNLASSPQLLRKREWFSFFVIARKYWERKGVSLWTKLSVYKAIVLTTLLYASETWTVYQRHAKKLKRFHLNCLRKLLRLKWQDKVPDTEILEQTGMSSIFTMLRKTQLRWAGHVVRMPDERLPKRILYGPTPPTGYDEDGLLPPGRTNTHIARFTEISDLLDPSLVKV